MTLKQFVRLQKDLKWCLIYLFQADRKPPENLKSILYILSQVKIRASNNVLGQYPTEILVGAEGKDFASKFFI